MRNEECEFTKSCQISILHIFIVCTAQHFSIPHAAQHSSIPRHHISKSQQFQPSRLSNMFTQPMLIFTTMTNQDTLQFLTEPLINQSILDHNQPNSNVEVDVNVGITSESVKVSDHQTKSKNIRFMLTYTFLIFAGRSIWNQSVLSAFVFL